MYRFKMIFVGKTIERLISGESSSLLGGLTYMSIKPTSAIRTTIILCSILVLFSMAASCGEIPPEKKVGYTARPGVVMIKTAYSGGLVGDNNEPVISFSYNDQDIEIYFDEIEPIVMQGSGFVVSSNGYIVTNAHVVDMDEDLLKQYFAYITADQVAGKWSNYVEENSIEFDNAYQTMLLYAFRVLTSDSYDLKYNKAVSVYFGGEGDTDPRAFSADIEKSSPEKTWEEQDPNDPAKIIRHRSGKDLAVLKITASNLPMVSLGDSDDMDIGEKVIVIGYPGVAGSSQMDTLSTESDYVPTVTSGIVSAVKSLPDGSTVIQTDAAIYHGNSGGPAFNEDGDVIGVATYAAVDQISGDVIVNVQGFNFLIPINVVRDALDQLNVDRTPSTTTELYITGLDYYWNQSYSEAEEKFGRIPERNTINKYATEYMEMCQGY